MSVLSNPQGTPERVWSLIAGLASLGGSATRLNYNDLLNPGYLKDGLEYRAKETLASNAHGAALSLKLVEAGRDEARLTCTKPPNFGAFADQVHDYLVGLPTGDPDAPILEAFAWVVAESDRKGGTGWIYQAGRDEFADQACSALVGSDEDSKPMNSTKLPAWRRWLAFLGLGIVLPFEKTPDFPTPVNRMLREMTRAGSSAEAVMGADRFVDWLAGKMPYLDRGRLYNQACKRISHNPSDRRLSPLISIALRELHDEGTIQLAVSGDSANRVRLSEDRSHAIDAFTTVSIVPLASS